MPKQQRVMAKPRTITSGAVAVHAQTELLPMLPPEIHRSIIDIALIDGNVSTASTEMLDHIRQHGIINPLVLRPRTDGRYDLIGGRRRLWCALRLSHLAVPASIVDGEYNTAALMLSDNALRSENIGADLAEIEVLVKEGHSLQAISKATGLDTETIKARMRLQKLSSYWRKALNDGTLPRRMAEMLARSSEQLQARVQWRVSEGERLTQKIVKEERTAAAQHASAAVLDMTDDGPYCDLIDGIRAVDQPLITAAYNAWHCIMVRGASFGDAERAAEARRIFDELGRRLGPFVSVSTQAGESGTLETERG